MSLSKLKIADLSHAALDVQSVNYDWSEGYPDRWEFLRDPENEDDEGPMMNYYYPLPDTRSYGEEDRQAIAHLPLVIIEWQPDSGNEGHALALSGGGMDLTWEICEAFIRLGFLPPVAFASGLPAMCGRGHNAKDRRIAAACRASVRAKGGQLRSALRSIKHAVDFGKQYEAQAQAQQRKQKKKGGA